MSRRQDRGFGSAVSSAAQSPIIAAVLLALTIWLWWGGWLGLITGSTAAAVAYSVLSRLPSAAAVRLQQHAAADAPMFAATAAAVLAAGGDDIQVATIVSSVVSPDVASHLSNAVWAMRAGESPGRVWSGVGEALPPLRPVTEILAHASDRGVSIAPSLQATSDVLAAEASRRRATAVRKAAVHVLIPLGLFGMPGFILVTVVPVVAAYASTLVLW